MEVYVVMLSLVQSLSVVAVNDIVESQKKQK